MNKEMLYCIDPDQDLHIRGNDDINSNALRYSLITFHVNLVLKIVLIKLYSKQKSTSDTHS